MCQRSLELIGDDSYVLTNIDARARVLGRLSANLEYLDIHDILVEKMDTFLNDFLLRLYSVGVSIAQTYFNTSIILPDERPRQQQQQQ
jgi:uncharacterized alpha-E superfamily protein